MGFQIDEEKEANRFKRLRIDEDTVVVHLDKNEIDFAEKFSQLQCTLPWHGKEMERGTSALEAERRAWASECFG